MSRAKTFNQHEVLTKAMETFWLHGYEKSSMRLLVQNMGINRASLYDTFGDKKALFLAAIAHYNQTIIEQAIRCLEQPQASKQAIVSFFEEQINQAIADDYRRGCFTVNSVIELSNADADTIASVNENLQRIRKAFYHALENAQNNREISDRLNLDILAHYLTCSLQGLCVTFRVNPDPELLQNTVHTILSVLEG
ncbi:MAG: TetR/AcrR family transcriptional regulator [Jaaginema sp. PMC 1079.18]|nr:TetR/AcrR family transcriptional regulator [Jaaginema sp. PMC 1080.18]MEC4851240.1 TetR/AcrR family transcriptional regulator [Jaaginema sp. PMC 1079.18]MEC4866360.1 TetR/AcrR family transcriptional regulator [Jaaginema sp. PMC 1078.18]